MTIPRLAIGQTVHIPLRENWLGRLLIRLGLRKRRYTTAKIVATNVPLDTNRNTGA